MPTDSVVAPLSLRSLRVSRGLDRADIAAACGVTYQAVGHWERGDRRMDAEAIRRASAALSLSDADELALFRWAAASSPGADAGGI